MFKKAREISDDKVNIAVNTYELVDKHIRKLDSDLAKFESEMKVNGEIDKISIIGSAEFLFEHCVKLYS